MMPLPELAALAAEKVPGFRRPTRKCEWCGGVKWGNRLEPCDKCDDNGRVFDDSPAALLMAVALFARKCHGDIEIIGARVAVHAMNIGPGLRPVMRRGRAAIPEETEESIARAALVALLRAHGVEVADG